MFFCLYHIVLQQKRKRNAKEFRRVNVNKINVYARHVNDKRTKGTHVEVV